MQKSLLHGQRHPNYFYNSKGHLIFNSIFLLKTQGIKATVTVFYRKSISHLVLLFSQIRHTPWPEAKNGLL